MEIMCMKQKYDIPGTIDSSVIDSFIFCGFKRVLIEKKLTF